jgi:chromate transporter
MEEVSARHSQRKPGLIDLFACFLGMGISAFGGPAMIAYLYKKSVDGKKWIDDETFQDGVALCQAIPGATAMQMAAYIGLKARGAPGAMACYVGFGSPAFLLMLALSSAYARTHALPAVVSIFSGLQAVIVAVVAHATLSFGRSSLGSRRKGAIALFAAGLFWLRAGPVFIILLAALLGMLLNGREAPARGVRRPDPMSHETLPLLCLLLFAAAGLLLLFAFRKELFQLAVIMSGIDLMAFGGGFVSLPLMFHQVVEVRSWMDAPTFLNGIVLGQFTPGPIVITATFVGYMAYGLAGALTATIAIFLPSFLMLVGVAPWFDRVRSLPWFSRAVGGILCSFAGLLFTVTVRFAMEVPWDWRRLAFGSAAFVALSLRLDLLWVVLAASVISVFAF